MDKTYGAIYIGLLFATFFQGVLTVQTYIYYAKYPDDSLRMKLLVGLIWITDFIHLVLISQAGYHYFITSWGNNAALLETTPEFNLHIVFIGLSTILCQVFFLRRIWGLSNRNIPMMVFLCAGCITTLVLYIEISIESVLHLPVSSTFAEVISVFSIGAGTDITMASLMCYYLQRNRSGFERTDSILSKVMQFVIATGLATSILAVCCLITYLALPGTFIFIAMHFSLGRMYTIALLSTLNGRNALRNTLRVTAPRESFLVRSPRTTRNSPEQPVVFSNGDVAPGGINLKVTSISLSTGDQTTGSTPTWSHLLPDKRNDTPY